MRRSLLVLTLVFSSLTFAPAQAAFTCLDSTRCADVVVPVPEGLKVPDPRVRILLPRDYRDTTRTYPVLYLLHGAGDTHKTWTENTDVEALTRALDLIVVMPDGGRSANAGWYSDWKDGSRQWESFHIGTMIPWIEQTYRVTPGARAIAGLSMGGFGTMHYVGRYPGMFRAAASFSGALDMMFASPASGAFFTAGSAQGLPGDGVWGNQVTDAETWRANNPRDLAERFPERYRTTKLLIATGNGLPGGAHDRTPPDGLSAFIEHGVWQMNRNFVATLDAHDVPHTDLFYGPGDHSWPYWRDALSWALPQIMTEIA